MIGIRFTLLCLVTLLTTDLLAQSIHWDEYRKELKEMAVKNHNPLTSYSFARKMIMQQVHLEKDSSGYFIEDVYCHRTFRKSIGVGPNRMPNHNYLNVEHTWPQSRFSHRAANRTQKADLHHLYPSESRTNGVRGNHYFSEVKDTGYSLPCSESKFGYDPKSGDMAFEPPEDHKGNVARALFYFSVRYDIEIPDHEEFYLRIWNYTDPVDEAEKKRNDTVEQIQGNRNPFIDDPEYADFISNF